MASLVPYTLFWNTLQKACEAFKVDETDILTTPPAGTYGDRYSTYRAIYWWSLREAGIPLHRVSKVLGCDRSSIRQAHLKIKKRIEKADPHTLYLIGKLCQKQ